MLLASQRNSKLCNRPIVKSSGTGIEGMSQKRLHPNTQSFLLAKILPRRPAISRMFLSMSFSRNSSTYSHYPATDLYSFTDLCRSGCLVPIL